jgi:predicted cupin superfamily sugar epimerase
LDDLDAAELVAQLGLEPIPVEGGWFRLTWRSPVAGAIVALFSDADDGFSALHRLGVTELWFAHGGAPFELVLLHPGGNGELVVLGHDIGAGEQVSWVVPAGVWMGGRPRGRWSTLSTVTVPPFADEVFEIGGRQELVAAYPQWRTRIEALTRA